MTDKQRIRFLSEKYERAKEERRGVCGSYLNEKSFNELIRKGYRHHVFSNGKVDTLFRHEAQDEVNNLRDSGHYARVIVNPCHNIKGGQTYSIMYRNRPRTAGKSLS